MIYSYVELSCSELLFAMVGLTDGVPSVSDIVLVVDDSDFESINEVRSVVPAGPDVVLLDR